MKHRSNTFRIIAINIHGSGRFPFRVWKRTIPMMLILFMAFLQQGFAGDVSEMQFDESSVALNVQGIGSTEVQALIRDQSVYLSITDVFDFLKIRNVSSEGRDSIVGYIINPESQFTIDKSHDLIRYAGKTFPLNPIDLIHSGGQLYLKSIDFGIIFGLECAFNFRSLSVTLTTTLELPAVREMRQALMRSNINKLKGEQKADTSIGRKYPFAHFGMADWSLISTQRFPGMSDTRLNLILGSVFAGGETNIAINYDNRETFSEKQQYYLWRYANNEHRGLRQVLLGKITSQATSSIYSPVVGMQITNTPTTFRRSFGTYTLSNYTQPGWIVELYVNNELVNYVKADASGLYSFQVPLVYGNSIVKLRFYGPWGEERVSEQNFNIPFNFLPPGEFEYTLSAGFVEDGYHAYSVTHILSDTIITDRVEGKAESRFSRVNFNYGVDRTMTIGGGMEYLSSVTSGPRMPFMNTSLSLAPGLLLSAEYTLGVRSKSVLTYRLPSNLQFELNYTRFVKNQTAINHNYLEERKGIVTFPFNRPNFTAFSRFTVDQIVLPWMKYTTAEWLLSGMIHGVNTNISTYALFTDQPHPHLYSNFSFGFKFPEGLTLTPQAQYEYQEHAFASLKLIAEKKFSGSGYLTASYEENFKSQLYQFSVGLRYLFPFAQVGITSFNSKQAGSMMESARGSLIYDQQTKFLDLNNRTNVGKGGIVIIPYLDLNANGWHDPEEPKVPGLKLHINGGRIEKNEADSSIRILDLEPYTNYIVDLDPNSFDNVAWQIKKRSMRVSIDPNLFNVIEVPVRVSAEVSGMITLNENGRERGLGKITVYFYNPDQSLAGRTLTESDGYFSFLGLSPGQYMARIDASQLNKLRLTSTPFEIPVSISRNKEGDIIDGLEFKLKPINGQ